MMPWTNKCDKILSLTLKGLTTTDIASELNISSSTIRNIQCTPRFLIKKQQLELTTYDKVRKRFEEEAENSLEKLVEIRNTGKPTQRVQLDAAITLLNFGGYKPKEVIEMQQRPISVEEIQTALLTTQEIEKIMERMGKQNSRFIQNGENPVIEERQPLTIEQSA